MRNGTPVTDEELDSDAKRKEHLRRQKIFDALATVGTWAIYLVPTIIAVLYILVLLHEAFVMHNWDQLGSDVKSMLIPVATYFVGIMSNKGWLQK